MQVNNVTGETLSRAASTSPTASGGVTEASKNTFLQLLIAQLEHQDPISPMENKEFTAQLAQFNTLEQMEAMNTNLEALLAIQEAGSAVQAAGLIGKEVHARGNTVQIRHDETSPLNYTLASDSANVLIHIVDDAGNLMHSIEKTDLSAGVHTTLWNGRDALGASLPDGEYHFTVTAEDHAGNAVPVDTFVQGVVAGIEFDGNRPFLLVNGSRVPFSALMNVTEAGKTDS